MANLKRYTTDYVESRRAALMDAAGSERNAQMDRYDDYYNLDIWTDMPTEGQVRVTSSVAHATVEDFTALLVTRKHAINVRPRNEADKETARAQDVETWLYGMRHRTMLDRMLRFSTHNGIKLSVGYLKAVYDPMHAADEFPVRISSPNPRNIYGRENTERTRFMELVETWQRTRREIEDYWGVTLQRPKRGFKKAELEQDWLDGAVDYTEYFDEMTVLEDVVDEKEPAKETAKGAVELAVEKFIAGINPMGSGGAGETGSRQAGEGENGAMPMMGMMSAAGEGEQGSGGEEENGGETESPEQEKADEAAKATLEDEVEAAEPVKRRVRKILHCVIVDDATAGECQMIKKPVILPGYAVIPYFPWSWILTPAGRLSALFSLTNGKGGTKSLGLIQAWNRFMSLFLTIAEKVANPPLITDDDRATIDSTPGAVNVVEMGKRLEYLSSPGVHPNVQKVLEELKAEIGAASVPEVLRGFVVNMSGQAITASSTQFEMRIGFAQQDQEAMLQRFYEFCLGLARTYYAEDPEAWQVYGEGKRGKPVEIEFGGDDWEEEKFWIEVKTSSSLPKDVVGMMGLMIQLVNAKMLSRRQGIDMIQKYLDIGADEPDDALAQILEDEILTSGQVSQQLATQLATQWVDAMTGKLGGVTPQEAMGAEALKMPMGGAGEIGSGGAEVNGTGGGGAQGFQPTSGMPSSAVSATPNMVGAAGNMQGMQNMMGARGPVQ